MHHHQRRHRNVVKKSCGNILLGDALPKGCRQCILGKKLVLFVSGNCSRKCYYCPLGDSRKGVNRSWANERPVKNASEVIEEAKRMQACGCGITGGDPLENVDRTARFLTALKSEFGDSFHTHLYTNGTRATMPRLRTLRDAGVDEIRFHWNVWGVRNALRVGGWDVGAEVPALPRQLARLKHHVLTLEKAGAAFVNLNELDFSETNAKKLLARGFRLASPFGSAVSGSRETALALIEWARKNTQKITLHFCPSRIKGGVQLRRRFLRTAHHIRKSYENVSREGLLVRGELIAKSRAQAELIAKKLGTDGFDIAGRKVLTSTDVAKKYARTNNHIPAYIVKTYPSWDALEIERIPLKH